MKLSKNETGIETTPKAKKPIFKRWWFWAVIVIVVIGAFGSGGKSDTPASSSAAASASAASSSAASSGAISAAASTSEPVVTEESKAAAKAVDAEIYTICTSGETDYKTFMDLVSAGTASDLDAYNTAKTLKSNLEYYNYTQLSAVKGDGIDDYKESVSLYLYTMGDVADKAMDYLDDPITSKLSAFQEATNTVQSYLYDAAAQRVTFLTNAGFSADEITAMTSTGTSDTAN